jgi:hypothetical protein
MIRKLLVVTVASAAWAVVHLASAPQLANGIWYI